MRRPTARCTPPSRPAWATWRWCCGAWGSRRRPGRCWTAPWRSTRRPTARSTPPSRSAWATWRRCCGTWGSRRRPGRCWTAPWRSPRRPTARSTPPSRSAWASPQVVRTPSMRVTETPALHGAKARFVPMQELLMEPTQLVQRRSDPSGGLRRLEELGVVGPAEGLGGPVVDLDELEDLVGKVLAGGEAGGEIAAAQHAAGQDREEDLDDVEPAGVFGRVGHGEARVIRQPCPRGC